ncbi:MFS transporter [Lactobacillus sp. ESL0679]|uniref:MFS transporter n=1 Tax=Lactobacillus sp. ESL0679 TaxID=2983209 RepID=UPI0023F811F3|nr:MFS transporter [Lactobacillus sp. ESL0679]MDF7682990.1 MFS transporter [Lactobacillus sp. ESL0679]
MNIIKKIKNIPSPYNSFNLFWSYIISEMSYNFIWPVMGTYASFWLVKYANFTHADVGLAFSMMSVMGLISAPAIGFIGDKILEKKQLMLTVAILSVAMGPFMQWFVMPMKGNTYVMAIIMGLFVGLVMNSGTNVNETYEQRMSFVNKFEFSWVRSGVTVIGFIAPLICAWLLSWQPQNFFWSLSITGLIYLIMVVFFTKHDDNNLGVLKGEKSEKVTLKQVMKSMKSKAFIFFVIFLLGTTPLSQICDQQVINYFQTFFTNTAQGTALFSYATTIQQIIAFFGMMIIPLVVKRIGYRNGLIVMSFIMAARILIFAFAKNWMFVAFGWILQGVYTPFWFVCPMGYVFSVFDKSEFATIQSLSTTAAVQISQIIFSTVIGSSYDSLGFKSTYLVVGIVIAVFAVFGMFFLVKGHNNPQTEASEN